MRNIGNLLIIIFSALEKCAEEIFYIFYHIEE